MKALLLFFSIIIFAFQAHATTLKVAAVANVLFPFKEIKNAFEKLHPDIKLQIISASSGKLTAQIVNGAPFDLFLSANMRYPEHLIKKELAIKPARIYAYGSLVIWTGKNTIKSLDFNRLLSQDIKRIAVANPRTAPYGTAAISVLKQKGLYNKLKPKFVYGESVSQTNQFIVTGSADIGFTAKSVVLSPKMKTKGHWVDVPISLYNPIKQGVVITKSGMENHPEAAKRLIKFLFSKNSEKIFRKYGYLIK